MSQTGESTNKTAKSKGKSKKPKPGAAPPSFLFGPTLYLRGIEVGDAADSVAWRPSPFPLPADLVEEQLNEEIPKQRAEGTFSLIACRRADDRAVGSLTYEIEDGHGCHLSLHADPLNPDRSDLMAEMLRVATPWLIVECDFLALWFETVAGDPVVDAAAAELGMARVSRFREALWHEGARRDLICYEALHPAWLARLGSPEPGIEGAVAREMRARTPRKRAAGSGGAPANAFVAGPRLHLRPLEGEDAEALARWSVRESDSSHDQGRRIGSPISYRHQNRTNAEENPPTWPRFAIVVTEGNLLIGSNGLVVDWLHRNAETETIIVQPEYRGKGYGTEAKHLLLEYAFERLGLHMVYSYVWDFNLRSCAALRKQGYRDAGRIHWTGRKDGALIDDFTFDLLAEEWRGARDSER